VNNIIAPVRGLGKNDKAHPKIQETIISNTQIIIKQNVPERNDSFPYSSQKLFIGNINPNTHRKKACSKYLVDTLSIRPNGINNIHLITLKSGELIFMGLRFKLPESRSGIVAKKIAWDKLIFFANEVLVYL
jgi:hypothetical protein